ncbi:adhesion G-protein coupled receptor G4-like [Acropora millepora]|uniref:adhesion G-protein coupled receptor G4-like n=1 Tax=Acropora millepora TaxID=45264 RepID=UPI001CF2771E|nr:adhesion G-protein coupled receptor G4-like [Acropora millepora]
MLFYQFVVASAFVILSFASSVTVPFKASIGISEVENYLPVINRQQNNLTNYNAKNLRSRLSFDVPVRSLTLRTTFNWTHNGTVLVAGNSSRVHVKSSNGALNIFYSKLEDEGAYQFFASNELGTMFARKFWIKFAVSGAFRSPTSPINLTMIEGEPFVLRCPPRAYSYPRPEYDWISATGQVISNSSGPRIVMEPNGDLLFSYVNASDFHTFMNPRSGILSPVRCRARGVSLEIGPPVYFQINSTNATMSPSSPVRFYTKPQGVYTVLTGDQLYLNCTAGGRPVPEIFWKLNGSRINDFGDSFLLQNFNRTLRLGSLHPARHDGEYACEAVGNLERINATFRIKVLDNVTAVYSGHSDRLEFRAGQYNGSVKMFCNTTGHPIINRTWYYNGVEMRYSARFLNRWSVDEHGILEIRQLQLKDFGVFQCVAKNPVSEGDRRTYLVVTGAPLPPTNVQLTDCSNHSTNITWDLRLPSDILPSAFIIEWRMKPNASHSMLPELAFSKLAEIPGSNRSYLVNNLEPWRYIEFRMRAKNSLGEGFPSKVLGGCITGAKKPIRALSGQTTPPAPVKVTVVGVDSSSVEVEWTAIQVSVDGYWILVAVGSLSRSSGESGEFTESPPLSRRKNVRRGLPEIASTLPKDTIFVHVNTSLRGVVTGLRPWTTYTLAVAGYNNAGTGSWNYQRVTTIDSKNSYFLLSLRITSEVFTEDLKNQSSSKYKSLKTNLNNEVSSLYQNYTWFKKASLLGLRPGSVVADVQLEVASPNMSVVSDVVSTVDHLGNFSLDRNETKMTIEPEIQNVTVIPSSRRVFHRIVISCFVIGGPDNLTITWYKASQVIGLSNRIEVETKLRNSTLTIQGVSEDDEGNYTCYAAKGIQNRASTVFIEVVPAGGSVIVPTVFPKPVDQAKCRAETKQGVAWTATAQGGINIQPCPNGARGSATRECSVDATWKNPRFIGCYSFDFSRLQEELEAIIGGNQSDTSVGEFLSRVVIATQPITNDTTRPSEIDKGDLLIAVNILLTLAEYNNASQGNISSEEDVHNLATVVSNLLDPGNAITWQNLEQQGKGRSRTLIKAVDSYGLGVAAALNGTTKSRTAATKNLLMTIKRITPDSQVKNEGLKVSYQNSSIQLPSEAFGSNYSRVVSVIYLTMNDILSLRRGTYENMITLPNTTVVSSTVFPPPQKNFIEPVKIVLQNKRVSVPSGAALKPTCVFWRPGGSSSWETRGCKLVQSESDANKTTCNCDHLTIFASLMDPFDSEVGEAHRKALEMISIVGCSISLIAVLVTIAVSLMFWRAIKSPRAKVILNLCIAIALSCIFVISEGFARDNKVGCIVVAALLHYFLLAMFSWMLCEGVLLYILVVKVFGGGAEEKVKYFYIFGWGFPAIIVAISLAVTQTVGYGTAHACWLDISSGLIWVFIAPVISIILVNIVVFILAIRKMMGTKHAQSKTQIGKVKAGIKASAVILPLLGITWLIGLFAFNSTTIAFKYIFAITNSLQGFMIFIFHCLLNKQIKDAVKRMRGRSSSGLVSSKSKQSPKPQAKFAVKQLQRVSNQKSIRTQDYQLEMVGNMDTLPNVLQGNQNLSLEMSDEECPEKTKAPISAPEHGSDIADEGREYLSVGGQELTNRSAVANCGTTGEALSSTTERAELKQHDNVRNEEDFEVKKEERKETIDTVQGDEEAFKLSGNKNVNVISQSAGTRIREIFHRGGFNVS